MKKKLLEKEKAWNVMIKLLNPKIQDCKKISISRLGTRLGSQFCSDSGKYLRLCTNFMKNTQKKENSM